MRTYSWIIQLAPLLQLVLLAVVWLVQENFGGMVFIGFLYIGCQIMAAGDTIRNLFVPRVRRQDEHHFYGGMNR